jgi:hypothetical protein
LVIELQIAARAVAAPLIAEADVAAETATLVRAQSGANADTLAGNGRAAEACGAASDYGTELPFLGQFVFRRLRRLRRLRWLLLLGLGDTLAENQAKQGSARRPKEFPP